MHLLTLHDLLAGHADAGTASWEFLREATMSAGLYRLPAGADDPQQPHAEDEVYVVLAGSARLASGDDDVEVHAGTVAFVPAGEVHRFHHIADDLAVLVIFSPPETGD
ncbi:MAG TPA: cupin domain-containing protein [Acidimicrobiales bacterium]